MEADPQTKLEPYCYGISPSRLFNTCNGPNYLALATEVFLLLRIAKYGFGDGLGKR